MRVTITGGGERLAQALAGALAGGHEVTLVAPETPPGNVPEGVQLQVGDLREPEFAAKAVRGAQVLVHLAALAEREGEELDVLDRASRGTYVVLGAAMAAGVTRVVVGSTLELFNRLPAAWRITEDWRPRPQPSVRQLCPWLAELSAREFSRVFPVRVLCLRLGTVVDDAEVAQGEYGALWLHLEDALQALTAAVEHPEPENKRRPTWQVFHIGAKGPHSRIRVRAAAGEPLKYQPQHDFAEQHTGPAEAMEDVPWREALAPPNPIAGRDIRSVVLYGAGGPLAAETARVMQTTYTLRQTDIRSVADILAANKPQSTGAPLPPHLPPPHDEMLVDVTDYGQVLAAAQGMDAIINCTVVRPHPVEAFRVNTLGAYNIVKAAVEVGIRRVVQTGPQLVALQEPAGYWTDFDVPGDAPLRAADNLYGHSKYLGQEIMRVFAEYYDLEMPVLLFCMFVNPETATGGINPFSISWEDAAIALRRCVEVESFPKNYEVMNIVADLPHEKFSNERARLLLDWSPRDNLERFWES